jgi:hypothetical protein
MNDMQENEPVAVLVSLTLVTVISSLIIIPCLFVRFSRSPPRSRIFFFIVIRHKVKVIKVKP